jgi:hypothetical protein
MAETSNEIFALLRLQLPMASQLTNRESDIEVAGSSVGHAVDQHGNPVLVVPLAADEADIADDETQGIRLETHEASREYLGRQLIIRCTDHQLWDQFSYFVDDCLASIRKLDSPPGVACLEVLGKWRVLLGDTSGPELSLNEQVGLIAELHFFTEIVPNRSVNALECWLGAESGRHDFVFREFAVEVKATTVRDRLAVRVHGLAQMELPSSGELVLYVEQLERTPYGDSVISLVEGILELGINRTEFLAKLASMGFRLSDSEKYRPSTFSRVGASAYLVGPEFPRLSSDVIAHPGFIARISKLEYTLDLSALPRALHGVDDVAARLATRATGVVE